MKAKGFYVIVFLCNNLSLLKQLIEGVSVHAFEDLRLSRIYVVVFYKELPANLSANL